MQNRPAIRTAGALAGLALMGALAGCSTTAADTDSQSSGAAAGGSAAATTSPSSESSASTESTDTGSADGAYTDGSYTATGSYQSPGGQESVEVTLTIADDTVTAVEVVGDTDNANSTRYQSEFIGGISDVVVGVPVDELQVDKVAGSSLTSGGFNEALETIKADAAA
ncbi:FMN-binding protein [Mycetocola reblochoni]|uniref:Uncharacterized protein n=2 Tax=Mycetocola reblochoni TaxID=331618 RepID=A0A1R4K9B6_9MICO|nr:FMN-binding protein [Mycetocola reblochoni]RLP71152.1 FMN-binding protein [Mycetocola reblochoni]SJN40906.1 hypothetical protein FM119_12260 [Mycetocola reblochoni REB411]